MPSYILGSIAGITAVMVFRAFQRKAKEKYNKADNKSKEEK